MLDISVITLDKINKCNYFQLDYQSALQDVWDLIR